LADRFVKLVVPLWENTEVKSLPSSFLVPLIHISKQLLDNETKPTSKLQKEKTNAPPPVAFQPDPALVTQLMEMGFSKGHVEDALRQIGSNNGPVATEWLLNNPEEIVPEVAVATEDESNEDTELALALAMSLGVDTATSVPKPAPPPPAPKEEPKVEAAPAETPYDILRNSLLHVSFDVLSQAEVTK
jgi:hypothetical protein